MVKYSWYQITKVWLILDRSLYDDFVNLLKRYEMHHSIKKSKPTFMQISGYPHFENVCSNILQFYFQPDNCHGLNYLFLSALFTAIGKTHNDQDFQEVTVDREYTTKKNNRIDLLITTNKYVIGIENKVKSGIYNDLSDYSQTVEDIAIANGTESVKVVLSIRDESKYLESTGSGFVNVTYELFISELEQLLGKYISDSESTYLVFAMDFIKTFKSFYGGFAMDNEKVAFFRENKDKILNLVLETRALKAELRKLTTNLGNLIDTSSLEKKFNVKKWFYQESDGLFDTLVYEVVGIPEIDKTLAVDIIIDLDGWTISTFLRSGDNNLLNEILAKNNISSTVNPKTGRLVVGTFGFDEKIDTVAIGVYEFLMRVKDIK